MNYYEKKLQEKKEYGHTIPKDSLENTKKVKIFKMKHPLKNAQLGIFK